MSSLFVFLLLSAFIQSSALNRFSLTPILTDTKPTARADHFSLVLNSDDGPLLIIHGGRDEHGPKSDTWTYVIRDNTWNLLHPPTSHLTVHPPALYGMVGGYRFVDGIKSPFLYITLGKGAHDEWNTDIWVMDLRTLTWRTALVDGDAPSPRFGAVGRLERFHVNSITRPVLFISHGYGQNGPLSDMYECTFHESDPYRATWRKVRGPISQYSTNGPHALWMSTSTFTAEGDLVLAGGCHTSAKTAGTCPSSETWVLRNQGNQNSTGAGFDDEHGDVQWEKFPGIAPRVGGMMAQGLTSFRGAYQGYRSTAVLYSGLQSGADLPVDHVLQAGMVRGDTIEILSVKKGSWLSEQVVYDGVEDLKRSSMRGRAGGSVDIIEGSIDKDEASDMPSDYYLFFGGMFNDSTYSNSLMRLSFDAFVESEIVLHSSWYISRPHVHGIMMFVSFGVLFVMGAFSIRFSRSPNGRARMPVLHIAIQTMALILAWGGIAVVVYGRRRQPGRHAHSRLGMTLILLATSQPVVASIGMFLQTVSLRWKKIKPVMHAFRVVHRILGLGIVVMGCVNVTLGILLLYTPAIVWVHWVAYCVIGAVSFGTMEVIQYAVQKDYRDVHEKRQMPRRRTMRSSRMLREERRLSTLNGPTESRHAVLRENDARGSNEMLLQHDTATDLAPMRETEFAEERLEMDDWGRRERMLSVATSAMRERLESGLSSMVSFRDPDAY